MESETHTPAGPTEPQIGRRKFFQWLTVGLGAVATAILGIPVVAYLLGIRKQPSKWITLPLSDGSAAKVKDFPLNETRMMTFYTPLQQPWDGMAAHTGVFVRYEGEDKKATDPAKKHKFLVLAVNCAHLGCPVSWFPQSGLFMCPCHGGVYYADGKRASGPPPRGLFRCDYRVNEKNELEVVAPRYPTLQAPLVEGDTGEEA